MNVVLDSIKKTLKDKVAFLFIIVIMISLWVTIIVAFEMVHYNVNVKDFNYFEVTELEKGKAYTGNVNMVLDLIADTDDGKTAYYLIVIHNGEYEGYCILETKTMQEELNDLCGRSWDYLSGETSSIGAPVQICADVCEADSTVMGFAEEWFDDDGNEEAKAYICPYMLVQRDNTFEKTLVILIISSAVLIGSVIGIFIYRKKVYDSY